MTKKGQSYYESLKKHLGRTLRQCYANPSYEKERAYDELVKLYKTTNETILINYGVISFNCQTFTMAFLVADKITHERFLLVETAYNHYKFKVD